jgi:hypothetical protein
MQQNDQLNNVKKRVFPRVDLYITVILVCVAFQGKMHPVDIHFVILVSASLISDGILQR